MKRSEAHRRFTPAVGLALVAAMLLVPSIAFAQGIIQNQMEGGVAAVSEGPRFHAYHQGSESVHDLEADFDLGTYDDTEVDATGTNLRLASVASIPWWDTDWGARRCFQVDNIGPALPEHQVRIDFDSTQDLIDGLVQSDGADYRAVADDDVTQLDLFVESGVGTAATVVWVQLDVNAFGTTDFCLYFGNAAATSVSSEADVFTYAAPRRLYFPLYWPFDGSAGNSGTLDIVSYVDNNAVNVGGAPVTLNEGQVATFQNITEDTVITSTGPIGGRGRGPGMDSIVPISFAGTNMIFPTYRSINRWTLVSPDGSNATVEIWNGTTLAWTGNVGGLAVSPVVDISNFRSGIIKSTNGVPVIVTHSSNANSFADSQVVPPWFGDDIYGVRSRGTYIGFDTAGSVDILMSDGSATTVTGAAGSSTQLFLGSDLDGNGTAMRFTNMTAPTGGIQQADRDGWESTAYLPERLLDSLYFLPSNADYIAFACPTAMTLQVGGVPVACTPPSPGYPGHAIFGAAAAGTRIESTNGEPFFAYYEDSLNQDETNLLGMKSAWAQEIFELTVTGTPTELLPAAPTVGTWTSPVIDTTAGGTNVFGLVTALATLPADTDVTMQVARGATPALALAAPFVGPDGTAATVFGADENPIPYGWDFGDQYYAIRVELSADNAGDTPLVDVVSLGYDLPAVHHSSLHVVETDGTRDEDWLLRVWTEDPTLTGATATLWHVDTTGLGGASNARFRLDPSAQILINGGIVTQASGPQTPIGPGVPHSVVIDTENMMGVTGDVQWQGEVNSGGALITHLLQISFV